jgi:uncharacterized phage protein gp47/JayE
LPITVYTLDDIQGQVAGFYGTRFPGRDLGDESWLGKHVRAVAMALLLIQKAVSDADNDGTPSSRTSTAALDIFAFVYGLPKNTGGYGRDAATTSAGGTGQVSGTNGTIFTDGLLLLASDGVTQVKLSGSVTIPGSPPGTGVVLANFVGVTTGVAANLDTGSVLTFVAPPSGAASTVTLINPLTGAKNAESDALLLARLFLRLQQPPKGGAAVDYRTWGQAGSTLVDRAYVYPLRGGTGTVQAVVTQAGSGILRKPATAVQTAVDAYVALVRPVTVQEYKTLLPAMPTSRGMNIIARLAPAAAKYNFDWVDTAATYTVDLYTAGSPATLRLNTIAPQSLKDAIDAGSTPRIVTSPPFSDGVPVQVRVTARDADVGGKTTLTLENPLPAGWVVAAIGDVVTAGGPAFTQTAQAILNFVDSLGPSRADQSANLNEFWEDTCSIARITQVALGVRDTDGSIIWSNVASATGITIDGATTDRQGFADYGGAPELLYAKSVVVKQ